MVSVMAQLVIILPDVIVFDLGAAIEHRQSTIIVLSESEQNYAYCIYDMQLRHAAPAHRYFGVGI
jgi:hypothetical protein